MNNRYYMLIGAVAVLAVLGFILISRNSSNPTPAPTPESSQMMKSTESSSGAMMNDSSSGAMMTKGQTVTLVERNSSGESGTAKLEEVNGKVVVTLTVTGEAANVVQPDHIHVGSCPDVGAVKYPLTNVVNGSSVTTLDVSMATLLSQLPLGINVHKSVAEGKIYVACGDIKVQ